MVWQNGEHKACGGTIIIKTVEEFKRITTENIPIVDWYFRGESDEYEVPFFPCIWREDHKYQDRTKIDKNTEFTEGELAVLGKCQSDIVSGEIIDSVFTDCIHDLQASIDLSSVDVLNWLSLAQHYNKNQRYPTRLIDITSDPLVALYFAVGGEENSSGFLFGFWGSFNDLGTVGEVTHQGDTFFDIFKIQGMDGLPYHPDESTINLLHPPKSNARCKAQSGLFIWNKGIGCRLRPNWLVFQIPEGCKEGIKSALKSQGYSHENLFPS